MSKILTLSKKAVTDLIVNQEVSSKELYDARYKHPIWPGGWSGITIGLGYDVGTVTPLQLQKDWGGILMPEDIGRLQKYCGVTGLRCKAYIPIPVTVSWDSANKVFYKTGLKNHAQVAANIYPELETLHPYEQTAIVGLVYNRGGSLTGSRRIEMMKLIEAIKADDDKLMASLIRQMKKLWDARKQGGLIARRELEADYVEMVDTPIAEEDKLFIEVNI